MTARPNYQVSNIDTNLLSELKTRVYKRVDEVSQGRVTFLRIKSILLPLLYFGLYAFAITHGDWPSAYLLCYWAMGVTVVLIYLNIIHDAAHNTIWKSIGMNRALMYVFDLVGANSYIWKIRHVYSHHRYPNVDGWDTDMEQSGILAIYPHVEINNVQKYQHWFCFFIYPSYLFNWLLVRDFRDFFDNSRAVKKALRAPIPTIEIVKLFFFKSFYLFYQIAVPIIFFGVSWKLALGAWLLQVSFASVFALFVLLPLHPLVKNDFPLPNEEGKLPLSWFRHQLAVTNDLTHNGWFVRNILGSFNFHVAHHIFPNLSHIYYPEISDELQKFASENGLGYKRYSLFKALGMHYQLLRQNANAMWHVMEE